MRSMFRKINRTKIIFAMVALPFVSCNKDFLERPPEDRITVDNYYNTVDELRTGTSALYNIVWFEYNERAGYSMGDIRGNNTLSLYFSPGYSMFTVNSLDPEVYNAWSSLYKVVAQSNLVMHYINNRNADIDPADVHAAIAECRFMRAMAYFHLVRIWGNVMIIENSLDLPEQPILPLNPVRDVYKFIVRDLVYAVNHLHETDDPGRLTAWSAKGLLAKVYLAYSGFGSNDGNRDQALLDSAKYYAADVCNNSGMHLMENYADLFKYKSNVNRSGSNNNESLFSLLWVPLGPWGSQNATLSDFAFSSEVVGGVSAWGSHRASYDILKTYKTRDSVRLNATYMIAGNYYPEINAAEGGYTYTDSTGCALKKYVPGGPDDNEGDVAALSSPLNTYLLRLADVYLVYAEAALGNNETLGQGDEAWHYFHLVRNRAGMDTVTTVTFDDIFYERRIELAMEYQFWYDLVSWSYFKPGFVLDFINNQERGTSYTCSRKSDGSLRINRTGWITPQVIAGYDDFYFPYPESEVVQNHYFKEKPVPYNFND